MQPASRPRRARLGRGAPTRRTPRLIARIPAHSMPCRRRADPRRQARRRGSARAARGVRPRHAQRRPSRLNASALERAYARLSIRRPRLRGGSQRPGGRLNAANAAAHPPPHPMRAAWAPLARERETERRRPAHRPHLREVWPARSPYRCGTRSPSRVTQHPDQDRGRPCPGRGCCLSHLNSTPARTAQTRRRMARAARSLGGFSSRGEAVGVVCVRRYIGSCRVRGCAWLRDSAIFS